MVMGVHFKWHHGSRGPRGHAGMPGWPRTRVRARTTMSYFVFRYTFSRLIRTNQLNIQAVFTMSNFVKEGDQAPPFQLNDSNGNPHSLSDYKGKKIYVMNLRYAACMMCNLRVAELKDRVDGYKAAGLIVLPIFNTQHSHLEQRTFPKNFASDDLPILVDPDGKTMQSYGRTSSCLGSAYGFGPCIQEIKHCNLFSGLCGYLNFSFQHCGCFGCGTDPFGMPSDFFIDESGKVAMVYHGVCMGDHVKWEMVDSFAGISAGSEADPMIRDEE